MNRRGLPCILASIVMMVATATASATLTMNRWTIDGGGSSETNGNGLLLRGTIGQPDAGVLSGGSLALHGGFWMGGAAASSVPDSERPDSETQPATPAQFAVTACSPSPFAEATRLRLDLPEPRMVRVAVHDLAGRVVRSLCARMLPGGSHDLRWNGCDDRGRRVPSGMYLVRVHAGHDGASRRVVWLAHP